jgi:cephalosporin-C deacetylase
VPLYDLTADELVSFAPDLPEPDDLDAFWSSTLAEARAAACAPVFERVDCGLRLVDTYDVCYSGWGGHRVRAWLHVPAHASGPLPAVVSYQGYGGGRGLAHQAGAWAMAGYASATIDTRGQDGGDTPDPVGSHPSHPGFMTRGLLDPADYYYRRVYADAVLAVDAIREHAQIDPCRVAVAGGSQGGGISIAVAALAENLLAVMPDVPFLCHFRRATEICDKDPYAEIVRYLKAHRDHVERAFGTLAYFDGAILARKATAPALFSVALMDQVCPPSTVYAAYRAYQGPKSLEVYPFNDHEGGQEFHRAVQLDWLSGILSR